MLHQTIHFVGFLTTLASQVLTSYANFRIKPTKEELRSYNTTERVLLTFDDYGNEKTIREILRILEKEQVKAAFFLIGEWARENTKLVDEIKNAGHWVGNHTNSHANLLKSSENEVRNELIDGLSSTLLRPPFGKYNKKIREIASQLGLKICYWDIDSNDWKGLEKEEILLNVFTNLHPSACILLHLHAKSTLDALPALISGIRKRGYELCYEGNEIAL